MYQFLGPFVILFALVMAITSSDIFHFVSFPAARLSIFVRQMKLTQHHLMLRPRKATKLRGRHVAGGGTHENEMPLRGAGSSGAEKMEKAAAGGEISMAEQRELLVGAVPATYACNPHRHTECPWGYSTLREIPILYSLDFVLLHHGTTGILFWVWVALWRNAKSFYNSGSAAIYTCHIYGDSFIQLAVSPPRCSFISIVGRNAIKLLWCFH